MNHEPVCFIFHCYLALPELVNPRWWEADAFACFSQLMDKGSLGSKKLGKLKDKRSAHG